MKLHVRGSNFFPLFLATILSYSPRLSYAQCAAAPIAAAACTGGNGAATDGVNINGGNTYWFTGGPSTFAGLNLNGGGTLRVCGNLTLSGMSYNGGNLIIESGGSLTINASMNLNGVTIINRGSLTINGNLTLQGSNNIIYNDLSTSVLTIAGAGAGILTMNGTTSFVINRGMITANKLLIQGTTGAVCMQNNAILSLTELDNNFTNSITYSGSGFPACVNVSTTAVLNNDLFSSASIHVCTSATPSGGAAGDASHGWGSAVVTNGCSSCATVLALNMNISNFTALALADHIELQWTTSEDPPGNALFYVEKSLDGIHFYTLSSLEASTGQNSYTASDTGPESPRQYYRIRLVSPPSGASIYSPIVAVGAIRNERFRVYPNPVGPGEAITLIIQSPAAGTAEIFLLNVAGQIVGRKSFSLAKGNNQLSWDLRGIAPGIYIIKAATPANGALYSRIAITAALR